MCKIIAVCNSKGGIGKTSTVQATGIILHQQGKKVLEIDADAQGHLSVGFSIIPESLAYTLTDLIEAYIHEIPITKDMIKKAIIKTNTIDLLPCTFLLDKHEISLNSIHDREFALSEIVELVKDEYDYILIDCNSSRNIYTINSLATANSIIIPVQAQHLSTEAVDLMLTTIKSITRRINPKLQIEGILMTMYQSRTKQGKNSEKKIREKYKNLVFDTVIPHSTTVADAQEVGQTIITFDPNNPVSIAYNNFVKELIA